MAKELRSGTNLKVLGDSESDPPATVHLFDEPSEGLSNQYLLKSKPVSLINLDVHSNVAETPQA